MTIPTIVGIVDGVDNADEWEGDEKALYEGNGWFALRQNGSHVIMGKGELRETIPMHRELKTGLEAKLKKRLKGRG